MSLFRSEEHVRRWTARHGYDVGAMLDLPHVWRLAKAWYGDPRAPDWRPRTRDENMAILDRLGLVGEFWQLA